MWMCVFKILGWLIKYFWSYCIRSKYNARRSSATGHLDRNTHWVSSLGVKIGRTNISLSLLGTIQYFFLLLFVWHLVTNRAWHDLFCNQMSNKERRRKGANYAIYKFNNLNNTINKLNGIFYSYIYTWFSRRIRDFWGRPDCV